MDRNAPPCQVTSGTAFFILHNPFNPANPATDDPYRGEVAEWSNAAVSKTVVGLRRPRVRIPVSPPYTIEIVE